MKFAWMKNLHGILHGYKWIMFHGLLGIALGPSKKMGLTQKQGLQASKNIKLLLALRNIILLWWRLSHCT
jgi:hypothetical protein